jgi:hypothetical protein
MSEKMVKTKMKKKERCKCPDCEKREREHAEAEELNFAVLIALMPVLVITLFSTIGLF